ncbi:hypothetical protein PAMC26577_01865 [Caballeronia sordidicola]|uniref:Uncharacterized protein n=1 Tax=Caballeronia sordidicola TaxID=196367 RepID=A0A242N913_CABSO|nr:hypothetical protein PAMC26577_01865 [Caballeronia sordidicola]
MVDLPAFGIGPALTREQFLNGAYHVGPAGIKTRSMRAIEPPSQLNHASRHSGSVNTLTSETRWL